MLIRNFIACFMLLASSTQLSVAYAQDSSATDVKKATDIAADAQKQSKQAAADAADAQQQSKQALENLDQATATAKQATEEQAKNRTTIQTQLDEQAALINSQSSRNQQLNQTLSKMEKMLQEQQKKIAKQAELISIQEAQLKNTVELLNNMQSQIDQVRTEKNKDLSQEEIAMRDRLKKLETQVSSIPTDPSTMLADESFPGAIRVPGTNASYKFGGFVKGVLVKNFNPLVTPDRFIPGSIPVTTNDETALASETSLTANQTRFNFDYRQKSELGTMRAFIEGDFAGEGDTFRLRHAFGQYRDLLVGKTWSAFFDAEAAPEEVDFEGINGRVVVRQTQIRYFPQIGKNLRWMISLENPSPEVTNGTGISDAPDLVTSIRRQWFNRYHLKTALLLRQIRAVVNAGIDTTNGQPCTPDGTILSTCQPLPNAGAKVSDIGWAVTVSGKIPTRLFNDNDNMMFQFNYGHGIGRYLTDLNSVYSLGIDGGQDGFIDPVTGKLKALAAFGGYISFQHWWAKALRSTFVLSVVNVNNQPNQASTAYHLTNRLSGNLIWSPIKNVDLGAEFLWGRRTNKEEFEDTNDPADPNNGAVSGTATQLQLEAVYRF